jgi:hypothetical protein
MALDACTDEICASYCPIPNPGNGPLDPAAENAFADCLDTVSAGACAAYATREKADCAPFTNSGGTGVYDVCNRLVLQTYNEFQMPQLDAGGPTTAAGVAQLLELACGGGDAGF